jgi:hypothetical protein
MTGDCMFIELYDGLGGFRSLTSEVRIVGVFEGAVVTRGLLVIGLLLLACRWWVGAEDWRWWFAAVS